DSVLLMEGGSKASSLSFAGVEFGVKDGKVVSKKINGENIPMKGVSPDIDYLNYFSDDYAKVKTFTNQIAGTLNNRISSADSFFGPSEYIDMIHSLQLKNSGAEISFAAPLSFNVTIEPGELNYQDLLNIYPFENQLYVIELTGLEIKNYLEYSYSKWINKMNGPEDHLIKLSTDNKNERSKFQNMYFNFDSAAGIIYEVDVRKGDSERITIKSLSNGKPFYMDKKYSVALSSYRANGGGDLLELGSKITKEELDKRVLKRLTDIREILFNQLKRDGSIEAVKLNTWKFVPENFVKEAAKRDFNLLFSK
ncbi:MAG: cpdB, partial [Bacteroidetes bacterium]|nr:cpdB [Bacteroidota bacterium]